MANRFINPENYPLVSNEGTDEDNEINRPGGEGRKRSLGRRQVVQNNAPAGAVVNAARNITIVSMCTFNDSAFNTFFWLINTELSNKSRTVC